MKFKSYFVYIGTVMRIVLLFFALSTTFSLSARTGFEITPDHKEAYELIIAMRFDEGRKILEKIKRDDPENVIVYHIENYIDFISIFISEEEEEFRAAEGNKALRLKKLKEGDPSDPYYLFSQAEVHLQWALTRTKFHEYFTAAREVNKAIGMLEKNQERFPDFISNQKSLSLLHAVAGTIPDRFKSVINLVSNFSGTIDQGLREINEVLAQTTDDYLFRKEAIAIRAMMTLHFKNEKVKAWNYLSDSEIARSDNPMAVFIMASTALKCGKNEQAIKILSKRTRSPRFFPFYFLDLMLGSAKLSRLDSDADVYIRSYVDNFHGQDYFKDAYRKLAWHSLAVKGDREAYLFYMSMCEREGSSRTDEDKSALQEAKSGKVPNVKMLKGRLFFDGGYYDEAMQELSNIDLKELGEIEKLEHVYRRARVFQEQGQVKKAIVDFSYCVNYDGGGKQYFSCSAALQLGVLYEAAGEYDAASRYFQECLKMNPSEYKTSLHQKAKSGLDRLDR